METFENWALNTHGLTEWSDQKAWQEARKHWDLLETLGLTR